MEVADSFKDYELIDASRGEKFERWKDVYLLRPDPQIIWDNGDLKEKYKDKINAIYYRSNKGGGHWENLKKTPSSWIVNYKDLKFNIKQMGFKHTGLFPEQYLVDDVVKFVKREIRRGNKYDAIIMDPPSYGRGANKEIWNIEKDLYNLVLLCSEILSNNPLFFLINSYTTGLSPTVLNNLLTIIVDKNHKGKITCGEIGLKITSNNLILPCGIYGRWESNE